MGETEKKGRVKYRMKKKLCVCLSFVLVLSMALFALSASAVTRSDGPLTGSLTFSPFEPTASSSVAGLHVYVQVRGDYHDDDGYTYSRMNYMEKSDGGTISTMVGNPAGRSFYYAASYHEANHGQYYLDLNSNM